MGRPQSNSTRRYTYNHPRPALTVDVVLFANSASGAEVLLIKRAREPFKGLWALPGGFVGENEPLESAAARELEEETGLAGIRLDQIGAFGDPGRDPRGHTVSIVFTGALADRIRPAPGDDAADAQWHSAFDPPRLAFDHLEILKTALERAGLSTASRAPARSRTRGRRRPRK